MDTVLTGKVFMRRNFKYSVPGIGSELVGGLHQAFLALGAFTILSTIVFRRLKATDGTNETRQKDIHLG